MSTAALLLALALLIGTERRRGTISSQRRSRSRTHSQAADPLADASALDVLAVCLSAGMSVSAAAAATADSAPPTLRAVLRRASDLLALGADPQTAWSVAESEGGIRGDDACADLMRLARRSAGSGTALAQGVAELAGQSRQNATHAAAAAAERAGVLIAGPLGLCFLPAFVCLGIVPVVAGLANQVFSAGLL